LNNEGSFSLFDLDEDGMISRAEMLAIVDSIYRMIGDTEKLAEDERTAIDRVDKIFNTMDADKDGYLSKQEFLDGGKQDPIVLNALNFYADLL
jgi:Ca2+-binding EF-hand superfamily protein